jgi:hypothetical protein
MRSFIFDARHGYDQDAQNAFSETFLALKNRLEDKQLCQDNFSAAMLYWTAGSIREIIATEQGTKMFRLGVAHTRCTVVRAFFPSSRIRERDNPDRFLHSPPPRPVACTKNSLSILST